MEYLYVGDIVNTHGIKGEVRILSDIEYKDFIFKPGVHLYIGKKKEKQTIEKYRFHKIYDMVIFEGIHDINDVLVFKGEPVYINREEVVFPNFLTQDLIGMDVICLDQNQGKVTDIIHTKAQDLLVVLKDNHEYMIPYVDAFIQKVDLQHKRIYIEYIKGLFDEN